MERRVSMLLAALALCACTEKPEPAVVQRVVLSLPKRLDGDESAREALRSALRGRLAQDDLTRLTEESKEATHLVRVEVAPVLDPDTREQTPGVVVQLRSLSEGAVLEAIGRSSGEGSEFVLGGFEDAWSIIATRRRLRVAHERDVIAALKSGDNRVRSAAMSIIGERKIERGVEPLCEVLENEDNELLVLRAVGALIALGDSRAIDPLIALAKNKDPRFVLQVVFAVGAIGGQTARGYLVTLASGHPVEQVRRGAEDALRELEGRASR